MTIIRTFRLFIQIFVLAKYFTAYLKSYKKTRELEPKIKKIMFEWAVILNIGKIASGIYFFTLEYSFCEWIYYQRHIRGSSRKYDARNFQFLTPFSHPLIRICTIWVTPTLIYVRFSLSVPPLHIRWELQHKYDLIHWNVCF